MIVRSTFVILLLMLAPFALAEEGVTDTEVVIGAHTVESGPIAVIGQQTRATQAYFDRVNESGGVNGRKIKFIRIDTQGDFAKSRQAAKKLVEEDHIFAMVAGIGPSHQGVYKYLMQKNVPDLLFGDVLKEYGQPVKHTVFPSPYAAAYESAAFANYIVDHMPGKKVCMLVTDVASGEEFAQGALEVFKGKNVKIGITEKVDRTAPQANAQVMKLKKEGCEVVLTSTYAGLCPSAITYGFNNGFKPKWFVFYANISARFFSLIPEGAADGIISDSTIAWDQSNGVPGWAQFKSDMDKAGLPAVRTTVAGYYIGEIFVEALKRAGKNLTREGIVKAMESMDGWKCDLCVAPTEISPKNHWNTTKPPLIISKNKQWELIK